MYDDLVLTFSMQNPAVDLPFHRFAAGDIVLISRHGAADLKVFASLPVIFIQLFTSPVACRRIGSFSPS